MIHYKDITFCPFWQECGTYQDDGRCPKALTDDVRGKALKEGLLISSYAEQPDCFEGEKG